MPPARVFDVALPVDQIDGLDQPEAERRLHIVNPDRDQNAAIFANAAFFLHPRRIARQDRPHGHHHLGLVELLLDRAVPVGAWRDAVIPPHRKALRAQRLHDPHDAPSVFFLVGNENVRHAFPDNVPDHKSAEDGLLTDLKAPRAVWPVGHDNGVARCAERHKVARRADFERGHLLAAGDVVDTHPRATARNR